MSLSIQVNTDGVQTLSNKTLDASCNILAIAVPVTGGTMTGPLILSQDPTDPMGAVTKRYADALQLITLLMAGD